MILTGEVIGNKTTPTRLPDIRYEDVVLHPLYTNSGLVYIGASASTCLPTGSTNEDTGMELFYYGNDLFSKPGNLNEM